MTTHALIDEFLQVKRFAMLGVSRNPRDFSRRLFDSLAKRGYDVIPVNPGAASIAGKPCFARVADIVPPVTSALLMTPRAITGRLVAECANAGMTLLWIYGIGGERDIHPEALQVGRKCGVKIVPGFCPFMFLPDAAFYHRLHGLIWKALGRYPN